MLCAHCGSSDVGDGPCSSCGAPIELDSRYRLLRILGQGPHALTYEAERTEDGLRVVAKELPLRGLDDWSRLERFRREAAILRQLDHPDIPKLIEELETGQGKRKAIWLVQEMVNGQSLEQELESHRYDETEVTDVIESLAPVLAYLHERRPPVVHRDIKPGNVIRRTEDRGLSLVDFGAVRDTLIDPALGGATVSGTFGYMAPEQLRGDAGPASDVYGLGATALRLLTRQDPSQHVGFDGRLRPDGLQGLTTRTRALLEKMMAADPKDRIADGAALLAFVRSPPPAAVIAPPSPPMTQPAPNDDALVRSDGLSGDLSDVPFGPQILRLLFSAGIAMIVGGFAFGLGSKMGAIGVVLVVFSRTLRPSPPGPRRPLSGRRRRRRRLASGRRQR